MATFANANSLDPDLHQNYFNNDTCILEIFKKKNEINLQTSKNQKNYPACKRLSFLVALYNINLRLQQMLNNSNPQLNPSTFGET